MNKILYHFWKRWTKEYLATIRDLQKVKANKGVIVIKVDIVLIAQDKMPRQFWRLGRVMKVFTSRDNKVRAAEVKSGKTEHIIRRPVNKLYSLNLNSHEEPKLYRGNLKTKRNADVIGEFKHCGLTN